MTSENEAYQMHCNFSQTLLKDHFQSSQMNEHSLIQWTDGPFPLPTNAPSNNASLLWAPFSLGTIFTYKGVFDDCVPVVVSAAYCDIFRDESTHKVAKQLR